MITIKLFGQGCQVCLLESSAKAIATYKMIAAQMRLTLEEALLDIQFFILLNTNAHNIHQLAVDSFEGLLPIYPGYIEIWFQRKKVEKIPCRDLFTPATLFPLYNIQTCYFKNHQFEKGIYLKEVITGCIGVYKLPSNTFDIDCILAPNKFGVFF